MDGILSALSIWNGSDIALFLLKKGPNLKFRDSSQNTLLHLATRVGKVKCVNWLIKEGADINAINEYEITPLHLAVSLNEGLPIVKHLLNSGANLEARNCSNQTPLHVAV